MKNRIIRTLFTICLICLCSFISAKAIRAGTGSGNMDGGGSGGGTQAGTSQNFYSSGDDGVRLTIIDARTKCRASGTQTIDYYRTSKNNKTVFHFGKICKLEYMGAGGYASGRYLALSSERYSIDSDGKRVAYQVEDLPTIVSDSNSTSNIDRIKKYFNNEGRLRVIASRTGISYSEFINGNYKLIIEPMIYLTFQGRYMAMTAHEAAKMDISLGGGLTSGGQLRAKFVSFTHKNLPLSIFLKKKDLGVKPWTGTKSDRVQNGSILSYLGIGILSFAPEGNEVDLDAGSYVYRPDTDVITSIDVDVTGGSEDGATCDNPISVQFSNPYFGTITVTGVVIPQGGSRPVWIKWHTPNVTVRTPTTVSVQVTGGSSSAAGASIPIIIKPLVRKEPSNPTADDTQPDSFNINRSPSFPTTSILGGYSSPVTHRSWHTYTCTKRWVYDYSYEDEEGNNVPVYKTVYDFDTNYYSSSISYTTVKVTRDSSTVQANPTDGVTKSGYGIQVKVTSNVSGSQANCTGIQSFCAYFPEFNYKRYRRDGKLPRASLLSTIELPVNQYSIKGKRVHFTPVWYPDRNYKVYVETFDAWTPAGMLCSTGTGSINISGSLWDNWYIRRVIQ